MQAARELVETALTSSKKTSTPSRKSTAAPSPINEAVAYLFTRFKANWGTAFTAAWEKIKDPNPERQREKRQRAYRSLQAEYGEVLGNADRELIDEVIASARAFHRDFPPRPPQLAALLDQVREQRRVVNADREARREEEERKKRALAAPAPNSQKAAEGRDWLKGFVSRRGNVRPIKRSNAAEAADTRDYYRMRTMLALGAVPPAKKLNLLGEV